MILYRVVRRLIHVLSYGWIRLRVEGKKNVPKRGPFILLVNHESFLDPLLVHAVCPRLLFSMTKSTQFAKPFMRWLVIRLGGCGFPTRRYRVDPQTVRVALRFLDEGRGVGIFPEGERSWDGRLQPLRLGTIRLVLKAGVPVILCGVTGAYDVWPRWGNFRWWHFGFRRPPVTVRFREPFDFGKHDDRADREALFDRTLETITAAMEEVRRA
jgi:1-acyl-sn-glycerol-3-phosphate acyltransferase